MLVAGEKFGLATSSSAARIRRSCSSSEKCERCRTAILASSSATFSIWGFLLRAIVSSLRSRISKLIIRLPCVGSSRLLRELLDAGDVVADEADENGLGGRLAVDPVFDVVAVGVALPHFMFGLADGGDHFFAVPADDRLALLNGLLHFGR